jgi:hypothetical protein
MSGVAVTLGFPSGFKERVSQEAHPRLSFSHQKHKQSTSEDLDYCQDEQPVCYTVKNARLAIRLQFLSQIKHAK